MLNSIPETNQYYAILLKETMGTFHGALTQDWHASTDYESDACYPLSHTTLWGTVV